jgi:hypothetical protein
MRLPLRGRHRPTDRLQIRSARCTGHIAAAVREVKVEPFDLVIRGGRW